MGLLMMQVIGEFNHFIRIRTINKKQSLIENYRSLKMLGRKFTKYYLKFFLGASILASVGNSFAGDVNVSASGGGRAIGVVKHVEKLETLNQGAIIDSARDVFILSSASSSTFVAPYKPSNYYRLYYRATLGHKSDGEELRSMLPEKAEEQPLLSSYNILLDMFYSEVEEKYIDIFREIKPDLLRMAQQNNNPEAQNNLALFSLRIMSPLHTSEQILKEATDWCKRSVTTGFVEAYVTMGTILELESKLVKKNNPIAFLNFKNAADLNFKNAADLGHGNACVKCYEILSNQGDDRGASIYLIRAAEMDQIQAQFQYALALLPQKGKNLAMDGKRWLKKAAENGHEKAQKELNKLETSASYNEKASKSSKKLDLSTKNSSQSLSQDCINTVSPASAGAAANRRELENTCCLWDYLCCFFYSQRGQLGDPLLSSA